MSVPPASGLSESLVADRLRAAGCVFAEDEARLLVAEATTAAELAALVDRRVAGQPLEHVLGWAEFCGLRVAVEPGVFVPRRRTELLVRHAAHLANRTRAGATATGDRATDAGRPDAGHPDAGGRSVVVDLCCGSGAVGVALGAALGGIELYAVDVDPTAVRCARRNVAGTGGRVYRGDLYRPLPAGLRGRIDILVANAPYVPTGAVALLPAEARDHEPLVALDGGADGLDVLRRVIAGAAAWLAPAGWLLVEASDRQAPHLVADAAGRGLTGTVVRHDDLAATIVTATRNTSTP